MAKKRLTGLVTSTKMQKTAVISIELPKKHPFYGKDQKNTLKFKARNDLGAQVGDNVTIEESRPYSKSITWRVVEVLKSKL